MIKIAIRRLSAINAETAPFQFLRHELMPFLRERFSFLPGISAERLDERYELWSNLLIEKQSACCLRVLDGTDVQGWFLSQAQLGKPIELTLATLKSYLRISGLLLYQRAVLEYAARAARVGGLAFSFTNIPVMNIYSSLRARFLPPRGYWPRWADGAGT